MPPGRDPDNGQTQCEGMHGGAEILAFDHEDARHAGEIRALLSAQGTSIGGYDVLIAGQARARRLTLVTRNQRTFQRAEGLQIENWES